MKEKINFTGRDKHSLIQALQIALPVMLTHSGYSSNIVDMIRLLEKLGGKEFGEKTEGGSLGRLDGPVTDYLIGLLKDVKSGNTFAEKKGIDLNFLNKLYFGGKKYT